MKALASLQARNAVVVDRATPPESPSSPKPVRNTVIGAMAGLLLGLGLVLARGKRDRRLLDPRDLEEAFGLPVLAALPDSEALGKKFGLADHLPPVEAEAFRGLSARLCHLEPERTVDSVLVTSAAARDGKSTVALNLAAAAAATGHEVLLVEAEVRRPILARSLGLPPNKGLTSVLAGEMRLRDACHEVLLLHRADGGSPPTMDVLLAGETRPDAGELIESARMQDVIQECGTNYPLVVIDSPPAGLISEGTSLMSDVGAVVVVGRIGKLTNEEAVHLRVRLEAIDAPTFGIVANFADT
jgi:capsular exopolysaccharide synthesis family protein